MHEMKNVRMCSQEHLASPPLLEKPECGDTLQIYLSNSSHTILAALIKEAAGIQMPIYYVSKAFRKAESIYPRIEMLAFTLASAR